MLTHKIVGVDFLPNVSGYPAACLFDTPFTLPGGGNAKFYTADCPGVVDLHFNMMAQNGIDGAFIQRFYGYISEPNGGWLNVRSTASHPRRYVLLTKSVL